MSPVHPPPGAPAPTRDGSVPPTGRFGVYVHVPFCLRHCPYCDFTVAVLAQIPHEAYADAVLREFEGRLPGLAGTRFHSLYFGGGTPGLWEPASLARVISHICTTLGTPPEITVEMNPECADPDRLAALRDAGVTRLSFGTQSFDDPSLRTLGRVHSATQALRAIDAAAHVGFPHLSADLILGIPGASPSTLLRDIDRVCDSAPLDHVSLYELTWEPRTSFARRRRSGQLAAWPEDTLIDTWGAALEGLARGGFAHYEVSNHARSDGHSRHNQGTWRGDEYIGIGTGAHGLLLGSGYPLRTRTDRRLRAYLDACTTHLDPATFARTVTEEQEKIPPHVHLVEVMMGALRTREGWRPATLRERFGIHAETLEVIVPAWESSGWVAREEEAVRMTPQGMWRADALLSEVHEALAGRD